MKAVLAGLPPASQDDDWAYEIKWDGYRTLAFVDGGNVRLQSSNGIDVTAKYPELGGLAAATNAENAIFDGELVVIDEHGRPNFEALQRHDTEAVFYLFDVLQLNGIDTVDLTYEQRRALLTQAVEPGSHHLVPAYRRGGGAELVQATWEQGLEGVMAKRIHSTYTPGRRSTAWRKIKHRRAATVAIGGYTAGSGSRSNTFGALLVGQLRLDGSLRFAGGVGSGFSQQTIATLYPAMAELVRPTCPFEPAPPAEYRKLATWIEPRLVANIEIAEWTNDGLVRHAAFISLADQANVNSVTVTE
jgi:bifunctional non-homologous end joining protein LigD